MAAPELAEPLVETMLRLVPDLEPNTPDFMPAPDPSVPLDGLGTRITWTDIYDEAKKGYDFYFGSHPSINLPTPEWVQQQIHAAIGEMGKAYSSFLAQSATAPVALARILDGTIDNIESNMLHDYRDLSQRLDAHDTGFAFIHDVIVPTLQADIARARSEGFAEAVAAQRNAEAWATENIFKPLYTEVLKVQPAIDASAKVVEGVARSDAAAQVAALGTAVGTAITPMRAALKALQTESEDCVQPMCETMGPKTDLGKFLKALQLVADGALLAELANLNEQRLAALLASLGDKASTYIDFFETNFVAGGETIGATIEHAIASAL